jgi:hypothetical protein
MGVVVVGVDVALVSDRTAWAALEVPAKATDPLRMPGAVQMAKGTPADEQARELTTVAERGRAAGHRMLFVVDVTGVGRAVLPTFEAALSRHALVFGVLITGGQATRNDGTLWSVPKIDLVTSVQLVLEQHRLDMASFADRDVLLQELRGFRMKATDTGRTTYGNDLRDGGAPHDDLVLATAMGVWGAEVLLPAIGGGVVTASAHRSMSQGGATLTPNGSRGWFGNRGPASARLHG